MDTSVSNDLIVTEIKNGSEKALDTLFRQLYQSLCYYAIRIIHDRDDAEDIVIEAFTKLWNRRNDFENYQNVKGFLFITTRNACFDFLKQQKRASSAQMELMHLMQEGTDEPDAEITRAELLRKIYEEIEKLPGQCRQVFELSVFEGLRSKEIAERMQISVSNVTSQKSRAVQLLRTATLKRLLKVIFSMKLPFLNY